MSVTKALQLRPEMPTDTAAIAEVTRLAFDKTQGQEVQMVADNRAAPEFIPELSLVAELDGQVVGHVITAPAELRGDPGDRERPRRVLALGPISVLPEFQRRGVGSALMERTLQVCAGRPEPMIVLWGHAAYYPRFGFRPAREFGLEPDSDEAFVLPLRPDIRAYAGLELPG
jgi:putative acetyltransferase